MIGSQSFRCYCYILTAEIFNNIINISYRIDHQSEREYPAISQNINTTLNLIRRFRCISRDF